MIVQAIFSAQDLRVARGMCGPRVTLSTMKRLILVLAGTLLISPECMSGEVQQGHWAFAVPRRPSLPRVKDAGWTRNAVDSFILDRLEQEGLQPAPEASRQTLIRRVTLDLTGLPASPEAVDAFLSDPREDAFEHLVSGLMATHAYAERRAQDWLDLARYADSNGFADDQKRDIWPYREWVIEAIRRNMPFDEFTIEQLAGDMLPNATLEQRLASSFHRNSPQAKGNTYPVEEYRIKGVVDRVNTTGSIWLGLTVACAQCHDHKFDPFSQRDYYSLFALFNNVIHGGEAFAQDGPSMQMPSHGQLLRQAELARWVVTCQEQVQAREVSLGAADAGRDADLRQWKESLAAALKARDELGRSIPAVPVMQELAKPRETFIHVRGNFLHRGAQVAPGVPAMFQVPAGVQPGNRLEFARWLVNGRNPLVARVVVNRVWQSCFSHGLVRTPADFGLKGSPPSHPELLDWLACECVASGWNVRHIHRLIVTSATYRQSSRADPALLQRDPLNSLLARAPRPRLPAEQIRDQALAFAGLLVMDVGGESVFPIHPANYWEERALPGKWTTGSGGDRYRRSLYTYWRRMALHPTMEILDAPGRAVCTVRRTVSNVPTQALVTLNDPTFVEAADAFGQRLLREVPAGDRPRLDQAFRIALSRTPDPDERSRFLAFLRQQRERTRDETAVWRSAAAVMLNLDETLCRP